MFTLQQLFYSMPYEIREKILSFTYKPQSKELLAEIREYHRAKENLDELTIIIETCNSTDGITETSDNIHERLWGGLYFITNVFYKKALIKNWKYKDTFIYTEEVHKNGEKNFKLMSWEHSFSVYFWMCIYH
jgi:hypothetical protein